MDWAFHGTRRAIVVLAALALAILWGDPAAQRIGDRVQIALPLLAFGCAAATGNGAEAALRFGVMLGVAHGAKQLLGDAPVNRRPRGGSAGFPSAHAAAAAFGASMLVQDCVTRSPLVRGIVILSAGYVGASRIDAGKHDVWQVTAGAVLGWASDRVLRHDRRRRAAVRRIAALAIAGLRSGLAAARDHARQIVQNRPSRTGDQPAIGDGLSG